MKRNLLHIWGIITWSPIILLFYIFYIIPFILLRQFKFAGFAGFGIPIFEVRDDHMLGFMRHYWELYNGHAIPLSIVCHLSASNKSTQERTVLHEMEHIDQYCKYWLFFFLLYFGHSIYLRLFTMQHSYYDNYFEIEARRAAGQMIVIPIQYWQDPNDRWIWW
jgi:hypothetical protein